MSLNLAKIYIKKKYQKYYQEVFRRNGLGKGYIRIALVENEEKQEMFLQD